MSQIADERVRGDQRARWKKPPEAKVTERDSQLEPAREEGANNYSIATVSRKVKGQKGGKKQRGDPARPKEIVSKEWRGPRNVAHPIRRILKYRICFRHLSHRSRDERRRGGTRGGCADVVMKEENPYRTQEREEKKSNIGDIGRADRRIVIIRGTLPTAVRLARRGGEGKEARNKEAGRTESVA